MQCTNDEQRAAVNTLRNEISGSYPYLKIGHLLRFDFDDIVNGPSGASQRPDLPLRSRIHEPFVFNS